jgi:hypothetical protein
MNFRISHRKTFKRMALATTALIAIRLFFVQQLIAAFLLFSVLFACIACVALILFLLDEAVQTALAWAEMFMRAFGRAAWRGWELAEGVALGRWSQVDRLAAHPVSRTTGGTGREGRMLVQKSS